MYTREDIPSRQLFCKSQCHIKTISVEINLKKKKLNGSYNPYRNSISNRLDSLNPLIDKYIETWRGEFAFIEDFYFSLEDISMKICCNLNGLKSVISVPTCFKNSQRVLMY